MRSYGSIYWSLGAVIAIAIAIGATAARLSHRANMPFSIALLSDAAASSGRAPMTREQMARLVAETAARSAARAAKTAVIADRDAAAAAVAAARLRQQPQQTAYQPMPQ